MIKEWIAKISSWLRRLRLELGSGQEEESNWARKQILEMAKLGGRLIL